MFDPQDFGFPPGPTFGLIIDGDRRSEGDQFDARLRGRLTTGALEHQLGFTHTQTQEDTFADGVFTNGFEGKRDRFDYQGTWRFGVNVPQALTLAAEHERQQFESKGPTPASAQNQTRENDKTGIAAEYRVRLPVQTALTLSVRRDHHELFEDATTYRITVAQPLDQRIKLRASYGTGIANPTFFELFGFIPGSFDPNPALKPEKSRGFDVGADFLIATEGRLSLTYFNADLEDEIGGTFDATTFRSSVVNLTGKSKRRGVEVEAQYAPSTNLTVWVAYTYIDSKQPDGQIEVRRPRHVASAAITYSLPGALGALTLAVDHNGRQEDLDFRSFTSGAREFARLHAGAHRRPVRDHAQHQFARACRESARPGLRRSVFVSTRAGAPFMPACRRASSEMNVRRAVAIGLLLSAVCSAGAAPQRVVSLNLCADELILRLADPGTVKSVTWLARDPALSNVIALAQQVPINRGLAEDIVPLGPDLVIAGAYTARTAVALLKRIGIPVLELAVPTNVDEALAQIDGGGRCTRNASQGAQLIADIQSGLARRAYRERIPATDGGRLSAERLHDWARARSSTIVQPSRLAQPRSRAAHRQLRRVAARGDAARAARSADHECCRWSRARAGVQVLRHPALERRYHGERVVSVPSAWWSCPGPRLVDAVQRLQQAAQRLPAQHKEAR